MRSPTGISNAAKTSFALVVLMNVKADVVASAVSAFRAVVVTDACFHRLAQIGVHFGTVICGSTRQLRVYADVRVLKHLRFGLSYTQCRMKKSYNNKKETVILVNHMQLMSVAQRKRPDTTVIQG